MRTRKVKIYEGNQIPSRPIGYDKVLCPDCNTEYITIKAFNDGKICKMCSHRLMWANRKGLPYVKFKDLSESEKAELQAKKLKAEQYRINGIVKSTKNKQISTAVKTKGKRVYQPPYITDYIKTLGNENLTARELYAILLEKYPEAAETLTMVQFQKKLHSDKIPFRHLTAEEKHNLAYQGRQEMYQKRKEMRDMLKANPLENEKPFDTNIVQIKYNKEHQESKSLSKTDNIEENNTIEVNNTITTEQRFEPIEKEVRQVLENKYKTVNCELGYDFSVDDYLDAFKVLRFLVNNFDIIVKKRNDMWDITNGYQADIIHTMENEISEIGDTTLQDKLHVLRDIRRGYEIDIACVELMKPFLRTMSKRSNELTDVITKLEAQKQRHDNPKYVPNVDVGMVDKYDWAQKTNPSQYKVMDKQLLTTNNKFNKKKGESVYVLRYSLSGAGFGLFKDYTREFSYPTKEEALQKIADFLKDLKAKNPGILITKTDISQRWN